MEAIASRKKGTLISIEGLDGAGKSTAIKSLKTVLKTSSLKVYREPGGTLVSEIIRSVLKGETYPENAFSELLLSDQGIILLEELGKRTHNPEVRAFALAMLLGKSKIPIITSSLSAEDELWLFNIARAQLVEEVVAPDLAKKQNVVLDRFIDSTIAYQGYGRGLDPGFVQKQSEAACLGLLPDITFYLRIQPETRHKRMSRRNVQDRIEKSGNDFFTRVAHGFDCLAANEQRIQTIDAEKNPTSVQFQILEAFETFQQQKERQ